MHAYQSLDRLDDPLGVANEIAVDLLRRQVLDHAGEQPGEMPSRRPPLQVADPKRFMASCSFRAVHVLGSLGLLSRGFEDQPCDFVGMGD